MAYDQNNIFTNVKRKDVRGNFENTMAIFQEKGIIIKPQTKPADSRISLATISPVETKQLFERRLYKKRVQAFMDTDKDKGLLSIVQS